MSARNGDKSRYQINRKRGIQRREKIRELLQSARGGPAQPVRPPKEAKRTERKPA